MKHMIFHLNILADPAMIRAHTQVGIARFFAERYGKEEKWFKAYGTILADWDSYHTDLNFSGEDGMDDMREARFRIMRAMFRLVAIPEPSLEEIHQLADEALSKAHETGDIFIHDSIDLIVDLSAKYSLCLISYFPQVQLEAMVRASGIDTLIQNTIGADTFEQYEMNKQYFEMLLMQLKAKPEECLYIDKQSPVIEAASQAGIKTFLVVEPFD